jgi:ankyrin repeat protein
VKDAGGFLPLHIAVGYKAPVEVVQALVGAYPAGAVETNKDGHLPLHYALVKRAADQSVTAVLCAHLSGAAAKDKSGNLPLHLAAKYEASAETVGALLAAHPSVGLHSLPGVRPVTWIGVLTAPLPGCHRLVFLLQKITL